METQAQLFLKRYTDHLGQCETCTANVALASKFGKRIEAENLCRIGAAILEGYKHHSGSKAMEYLTRLQSMSWSDLVFAALGAASDSDILWVICLDVVIAQKVEMIWGMSEEYWRRRKMGI